MENSFMENCTQGINMSYEIRSRGNLKLDKLI